jgi:hypothetical protein
MRFPEQLVHLPLGIGSPRFKSLEEAPQDDNALLSRRGDLA